MSRNDASFVAFFLKWSEVQSWAVPPLHIRMCQWLDECDSPERVMMIFRGAAKSTTYAVYKAYRLWKNRNHRSLVWSADNDTAGMLTADTLNVLRNHPWCGGMLLGAKPAAKRFWVIGARDSRNASMRAVGVTSNATGSRADDVDFDDIEVPGNIETTEARLKLRQRISESTHIAVPGAQKTYIGTPHTHESIYPERIAAGAAVIKIALFEYSIRYSTDAGRKRTRFKFDFIPDHDGLYVMTGIHTGARLLVEGLDYRIDGQEIVFAKPPGVTVDIAACCAWPERFDRKEIEKRRKETLTFNAWDSQYMLEAKPLTDVRLDPDDMKAYDAEPIMTIHNRTAVLMLGKARIVGMSCRWDPASGKVKSDASSVALMLQDDKGRRYWHRAEALTGPVCEFGADDKTIIGGQVWQLCDLVARFKIPRIVVETNGIGQFAPTVLKACLKQRKLRCGVAEEQSVQNKNKRILEAFEDPLSSGMMWAHVSVLDGPASKQMRDWNPSLKNQPDDYIDAGAGAITDTPERVRAVEDLRNFNEPEHHDWRPDTGTFEVALDFNR